MKVLINLQSESYNKWLMGAALREVNLDMKLKIPSFVFILTVFLIVSPALAVSVGESSSFEGSFNGTSDFRNDTSGNLGFGYQNGTSGDSLIGYWRYDKAEGTTSTLERQQGFEGSGWTYNTYGDDGRTGTTGSSEGVTPYEGSTMFSFDNTNDGVGYARMNFTSIDMSYYQKAEVSTQVTIDDEIAGSSSASDYTIKGQVSRDGGENWDTVWSKNGQDFSYTVWSEETYVIDDPTDQTKFRLEVKTEYLNNYFVDDIKIEGIAPKTYSGYSGNNKTAELFNQPGYSSRGIMSTSGIGFDGTDDYVELPQTLAGQNEFTVSFWANISAYDDGRAFSSGGTGTSQILLWPDDTGEMEFIVWDGSNSVRLSSGKDPRGWTHLTGTWDGSTAKLYINGTEEASTPFTGDGTVGDTGNPMYLGRGLSGSYFKGVIDEFQIYDTALSQEEVNELYFNRDSSVFIGEYSKSFSIDKDQVPVNLEVGSDEVGGQNESSFKLSNSDGNQALNLDDGFNYRNYSLDFKQGGNFDLEFNFTSPDPFKTPFLYNYSIYTDNIPSISRPGFNYNPLEATQTLNVTVEASSDEDDIQQVLINLTAPNSSNYVENGVMQGTESSKYYFTTEIPDQASNIGEWSVNVTATDLYTTKSNSSTFQLVEKENPVWRNQVQEKDIIAATANNNLQAEGKDEGKLTQAILATNETGSFQNKTSAYGSPLNIGLSGIWAQTGFSWSNNSIKGDTIAWKIWYSDALGQYNSTDVKTFFVESEDNSPPGITIFSPENKTYDLDTLSLEVKADEPVDSWLYNLEKSSNNSFDPNVTLSGLAEGSTTLSVWANDTAGNFGSENVTFNIDTTDPETRLLSDTVVGNLTQGDPVNISVELRDDNSGLREVILSTNETGNFENKTKYGSPETYGNISDTWLEEKFTWDNNTFVGELGYRLWVRDEAGNWLKTNNKQITVEKPAIQLLTSLDKQSDWLGGNFSGTSADRDDNSGILGLGYLNSSTNQSWSPEREAVGIYRFDKTSGVSVNDYSSLGNDGSIQGGITKDVSGVLSTSAFNFNGFDSFLNISRVSNDISTTGFTWTGWIRTDSGDKRAIVAANTETRGNRLLFYLNNGVLSLYDGSFHDADTIVSDGNWHHIAVTLDGSTGNVNYYVDGVKEPTSFNTGTRVQTTDIMSIGQEYDSSPSDLFVGDMDEIQIYNKSLSDKEINRLYLQHKTNSGFKGSYNRSLNLKPEQRIFALGINSSNIKENNTNLSISTTKGETEVLKPSTGDNYRNYTLDFTNKGGNATLNINMSSDQETQTPLIEKLNIYTKTEDPPEYDLTAENITLNRTNLIQSRITNVKANVSNQGENNLRDVRIRLKVEKYNGSWNSITTQNKIIDLDAGQDKFINFDWTPKPGSNRIKIITDPTDLVDETNETNNNEKVIKDVSSYNIFYGGSEKKLKLNADEDKFLAWFEGDPNSNIYFADADTSFNLNDLAAPNKSGDLVEIDDALNLTYNNDSISNLWDEDNDGFSDQTETFNVGTNTLNNVPVTNSTNQTSFITGILYNKDQGTPYDGTQDIVMVTKTNPDTVGRYGKYDYEIKVPYILGSQKPPNDKISIFQELD